MWHPLNEIAFRRRGKLLVAQASSQGATHAPLATVLHNIGKLGYVASPRLVAALQTWDEASLTAWYRQAIAMLRKHVGAHVAWQPMYPNFPTQVMTASESELYLNALLHYFGDWVGARIMPDYQKLPRPPLLGVDQATLRVLDIGDENEIAELARALISANTSIAETDQRDIAACLRYWSADLTRLLPTAIPHKENLAFVASKLIDHPLGSDVLLGNYFQTATDVLRLAVARSQGDVSLATPTKFAAIRRKHRRMLLALLERCTALDEDMWRHRGPWLRLGERLHPGEYAEAFPKTAAAFGRLRNDVRPNTFAAHAERALADGDANALRDVLRQRPGEFVRRLEHALRRAADPAPLLSALPDAARAVATPVLLQALVHFENHAAPPTVRAIFPKGQAAKLQVLPWSAKALPSTVIAEVVATLEQALRARFAQLPALGPTFVADELCNYLVPFSQRSASKALRTLVRGSRVPIEVDATLRFFLWWREGIVHGTPTGRVDIDLSTALYDDNFAFKMHLGWTNLRSQAFGGYHSGDITSAPQGACEFIDLDLPSVRKAGVRYVVPSVFAFTTQAFCDLPECFMGWMQRKAPNSGEIFEPQTVVDRVDLATNARACLPAVFDLYTGHMIWADVGFTTSPHFATAIDTNRSTVGKLVQGLAGMKKPTLHRLFTLHASARGTLVADRAQAKTVFAVDAGTTPYDIERIMAEYLR